MKQREIGFLAVAGGLLPVVTILGVLAATASFDLPWVVPFFALLVSPLFGAVGLYLVGVRRGSLRTPEWLPTGGRQTFGDQIPARYHEEFAPETLGETTEEPTQSTGRLLALSIVYLVSIPVYTAVIWGLFG